MKIGYTTVYNGGNWNAYPDHETAVNFGRQFTVRDKDFQVQRDLMLSERDVEKLINVLMSGTKKERGNLAGLLTACVVTGKDPHDTE